MYKRILVCLDGSDLAEQIVPYAIEQALHFDSEVILIQVFEESSKLLIAPPPATGGPVPFIPTVTPEAKHKLEEEAKVYLERWAEIIGKRGAKVRYTLEEGSPAVTILDYCSQHGIDLIAIATHGRSGLSRTLAGSVADEVIRRSHIPILVIRPR